MLTAEPWHFILSLTRHVSFYMDIKDGVPERDEHWKRMPDTMSLKWRLIYAVEKWLRKNLTAEFFTEIYGETFTEQKGARFISNPHCMELLLPWHDSQTLFSHGCQLFAFSSA